MAYGKGLREEGRRHLRRSSGVYKILPQSPKVHYPIDPDNLPLESEANREKFEMLLEQIHNMESYMVDLRHIQEAISNGFNEPFASFMYGMSITMWCNNFPNCPSRDQWEKVKDSEGVDNRLQQLQEKINAKREENEALKQRLNKPTTTSSQTRVEQQKPIQLRPSRPLRPSKPHRPTQYNKAPPSSDDTYNTNDSFVDNPRVSRIPQPRSTVITSTSSTAESRSTGPNLNQAPRYLRGLFENTTSANRSARFEKPRRVNQAPQRVNKLAQRPPFR